MFGWFSKKPQKGSSEGDPPPRGGFLGFGQHGPSDHFSKAEVKKLNKHWAKTINRRDMNFQEFLNLPDWNHNPLVPRALELTNPAVKASSDLTKDPVLRLQDFINVYEKLRSYQKLDSKLEFGFKMMDFNQDGSVDENDLSIWYMKAVLDSFVNGTMRSLIGTVIEM